MRDSVIKQNIVFEVRDGLDNAMEAIARFERNTQFLNNADQLWDRVEVEHGRYATYVILVQTRCWPGSLGGLAFCGSHGCQPCPVCGHMLSYCVQGDDGLEVSCNHGHHFSIGDGRPEFTESFKWMKRDCNVQLVRLDS